MNRTIKRIEGAIKEAENCFSNVALKGLQSMQLAQRLGALSEEGITNAEAVLDYIEHEASTLVALLANTERANRLCLYGLIAQWHEAIAPRPRLHSLPGLRA